MSKNSELTSKMNQYSPKASTQDSEAEIRRRQELVSTLERLVEKASKGNATSSDIAKAQGINAQLGGQYSGLVSAIESAVEQKEAAKSQGGASNSLSNSSVDPVAASKEYFNQESVKKSEDTLRKIESGDNSATKEDLAQTWKSVHSNEDRSERKELLDQLLEKKKNIFKGAIIDGREKLSEEEKRRIADIDQERLKHLKREHHDKVLERNFGRYDESKADKILQHEENQNIFKQCAHEVAVDFRKIESKVVKETEELMHGLQPAKQDKNPDKTAHISAVDSKATAIKEEIRQERAESVTKITKDKIVTREESIIDQSSKNTNIKNRMSGEEARAAKAALKAKKALTEVKSSSHLTPDLTPPVKKGEEKQKDAGYKR